MVVFLLLDIAPQNAEFLHGIANSAGTLAAIISTIGTGYFVQWLGSFKAFLTLTACLYFVTASIWNLYATLESFLDQIFTNPSISSTKEGEFFSVRLGVGHHYLFD